MAKSFRTFNELPLELVLDIAEHLPAHNIASLALTCKSLYVNKDLSSLWRHSLCELGWPDNCDAHPLVFNHEQLFFQALLAKVRPDEQNDYLQTNALWWPSWNHSLTFDKLHHIMRPLDWNKVYGAPLESIAVHTDWEQVKESVESSAAQSWLQKLDLYPEVVRGVLVIHTCQRILLGANLLSNEDITRDAFVSRCARQSFKTCHCYCYHPVNNIQVLLELSVNRTRTDGGYLCLSCQTEWSFVIYDHKKRGLEIVLDTWTNLGSCNAPYSSAWLSASRACDRRCLHLQPFSQADTLYPRELLGALARSDSAIDSCSIPDTTEWDTASDSQEEVVFPISGGHFWIS